ncbi:hypothetical protein FHS15_002311 [Paenibacillus castaneae]|nr:hypothetical protein [Paenibacillus castaneae]
MSCKPFCPTVRVYDPPRTVINDVFHPQIVEVVHQINVVTRHHCVPVEKHLYQYCYHDETQGQEEHNSRSGHSRSGNRSRNERSYISKLKKTQKKK